MKRREFFKKSFAWGASAGLALAGGSLLGTAKPMFANNANPEIYDMAAVMGGEPAGMFDRAMNALGGIKQFVRPNQTVVVKPNIGWNTTPERAGCTNPELVAQIVKHCKDAGAKKVYVVDHTADVWKKCYANSGIEKAAKEAGAIVVSGANHGYYQKVDLPGAVKLKQTEVHELILESDVLINVPVLKHHVATGLTIGMKNLMGVVWDRLYWHANDLHQCVTDFAAVYKPTLVVVDAYRVIKRNGPTGVSEADVVKMKGLIVGADQVAVDSAAARMFGKKPEDIRHIALAHQIGLGTMDLSSLRIKKIKMTN